MDIDYKVWDKYGIKVPVVRETVLSKMENRTLQECAAELSSNVENLHDSYVLENVSDEEELCCLLYTSPSPRDLSTSRMPSSA